MRTRKRDGGPRESGGAPGFVAREVGRCARRELGARRCGGDAERGGVGALGCGAAGPPRPTRLHVVHATRR